jgi:hypothetical protein
VTLLRLYPALKLRVMSAGEAEATRLDLSRHLIVIGGPDYNPLAERVLRWGHTQFEYRSPYITTRSVEHPDEIVLYDKHRQTEYCHVTEERDFGYFERIPNPHNPRSRIIMIGGCHTIGVAGAVKAFSMAGARTAEYLRVCLVQLVMKNCPKLFDGNQACCYTVLSITSRDRRMVRWRAAANHLWSWN